MPGEQTPPLEVSTAELERLDDERISLRLAGTWRDLAAASRRLTLIVDPDERRLRFAPVPRPRQSVGASVAGFAAEFDLPAWLENDLAGAMTLEVGETAIALPALGRAPRAGQMAGWEVEDVDLLGPLREELAQRARVEARLRSELAALRARVEDPGPAPARLEAVRLELAEELVRVRRAVETHEQRRGEVESRAMVLAAELSEVQQQQEETEAELETAREECAALRARVAELEAELTAVRREASTLRTAELSARAGREAALAEVGALHDELDRLAVGGSAADAGAGALELERAEALLAEARMLTESLD